MGKEPHLWAIIDIRKIWGEGDMIVIQNSVFKQYLATLKEREVAPSLYADYTKWLRYYLNFCAMYQVHGSL